MSRKARLWLGATLLLVIIFNYAIIGFPLIKRASSIEAKTKAMLVSQVKSGKVMKNSEDEFILEILKRERSSLGRKILILNGIAISLTIAVASWTAFGMIVKK